MGFCCCSISISSNRCFSTNANANANVSVSHLSNHKRFNLVTLPLTKPKSFRIQRLPKVFAFYGLTDPPYKLDALEPYMSQRTLELHWGQHHRNYVEGLNKQLLLNNNPLYGCTMEELVKLTYNNGNPLPEFNNAAQVWNHDFFWESMQPGGGSIPGEGVMKQMEKDFGSFTNFKEKFTEAAQTLFGSGWIWLVLKPREKRLAVVKTSNAVTPLIWDDIPIISLDMWEHAYYTDYKWLHIKKRSASLRVE
ncbi:hypothetical protein AQUCO_09100083v1 [Aquilegia coerulea]|uniref:Superoxide dismutase n=1 Tax=Aquilegia coerulea TaxID=218851 RepID=A0A2G5C5W5_AQUCA|nr:hypothetical protein AQUCO_09100083v1 [Aquilegia coerulea]